MSSGFLRPWTWMFEWTVERPFQDRPRQSNAFYFKGHKVHLQFSVTSSGGYCMALHVPPSFPSCRPSEITVRVENKNKTLLFLHSINHVFLNRVFWYYTEEDILAAYPDFYKDGGFLTFLFCDVDSPKGSNTSLDQTELSSDFGKLLTSGDASDVQLKYGAVTRQAHRPVLAARSEVFSAMFRNKMVESTSGVVDIHDVDETLFNLFLKYVYTGKLSDLREDNIQELYALADRYAVHSLKKLCSDRMVVNLSADNYQTCLLIAEAYSDRELKEAIIDSITDHFEWLDCGTWTEFSKERPTLANEIYRKCFFEKRKK